MSRKITFLTLFLWLMTVTFPVIAQQKTDTTYTFRFVSQKDMFYVPWNGNDTELARLLECIENSKATIFDGKLPLLVDGYCNSLGGEAENLATAKIRANRVKSELITRAKIKEENFITHNHATGGDFVIVRLTVPAKETAAMDAEAEARRRAEAERLETETRAEEQRKAEEARPLHSWVSDNGLSVVNNRLKTQMLPGCIRVIRMKKRIRITSKTIASKSSLLNPKRKTKE